MGVRTINLDLDICKKNYLTVDTVKSLDSIIFKISIFENGISKDITRQTVALYCKRKNNSVVEQKDNISVSNNLITVNVKNSCFQVPGTALFELELKDSSGTIATMNFSINVEARLNSSEVISATNEISGLNAVVKNLENKAQQLDNTIVETNTKLNSSLISINNKGDNAINAIKKDYENLKESITGENIGANLQEQINSNKNNLADLNKKIINTYTKTEVDKKIQDAQLNSGDGDINIDLSNYATKEDLRRIELTPGPKGEQGPIGLTGPQGPKGDTGTIDTSNFYNKEEINSLLEDLPSQIQNNYEHEINTEPSLRLGYNCIIANGQTLTFPNVKQDKVSVVKVFVNIREKEKKVSFGDVEIFWDSEPNFNKVGIYKIEFERGFDSWIGNCKYCVSNDDSRNPIYTEIAAKLKENSYQGPLQVIENEIKEDNEIVITLNSKHEWGNKVKTYFYDDGKFYWLNSEVVEDDMIRFKSNGKGVYFVALDTAPIYDRNAMELIYSDEFDSGNGDIDHNKWEREVHGARWTNNEEQCYTDKIANSYVKDGKLVIKAMKEPYGNGQYTSARLISKNSFLYGRFDIKAKLPTGKGTWPAIWMLPANNLYGEWPKSGEIDIMENVGKDPEWIHGSLHSGKYNFKNNNQVTSKISIPTNYSEYHTYSAIWTPEYIEFLVDDEAYLRHSYNSEEEPSRWEAYPYDKPYNILLNLAIGGSWGGEIDDSIMPAYFYIDNVKVYDLGFNKFDKTPPQDITNLKFAENVVSWDYCYDNVAVKEYKVSLDNGEVLTTQNNYLILNSIDLIGAISASVVAIDYSNNKSNPSKIAVTPSAVETLFNEARPLTTGWNTYVDTTAKASLTQGEYGVILGIANGGSNVWDIQLIKNNCQLVKDSKYSYSITLSSTVERDVKLVIQNQEDYQGIHYNDVHLKANEQTKFKGEFYYEGETMLSDLVLQVGNNGIDCSNTKIYLDKFVFVKQ